MKEALDDEGTANDVYAMCLKATRSGGDCAGNRGNDCKKVFARPTKEAVLKAAAELGLGPVKVDGINSARL